MLNDHPTQAYNLGYWDKQVYHYICHEPGEAYFGLGRCAGDMNRTHQRYEVRNIDAMGCNARATDPLYKHISFYVT